MKKEKTTMEKNPVIQTAKWAISMMKNKIVITLLMLATGIVFLVSPSGNMNGTVILIAIFIIIAAAINIGLHLVQKERTKLDVFFAVLNALLVLFGIFCLISPSTVEPVVRVIFAILTILSNLVNLIEIFQLENKKSWRFFVSLFVF